MTELKPCPFCPHGESELVPGTAGDTRGRIFWRVECSECHGTIGWHLDKEDAIKAWNRRVYPPEVQQAIERMKPKKVKRTFSGESWEYFCPACGIYGVVEEQEFCDSCGQRLDWEKK